MNLKKFQRRLRKVANLLKAEVSLIYSLLSGRAVTWGMPPILMIEPTNHCNLKCPQCVTGANLLERPTGMMSFENFARIIQQSENSLMFLMLFYCGEPLLNPELIEMIRYAKDRGIIVLTSTNGHMLRNRRQIVRLLTSGLDRLVISLYGASRETYEFYENRGDFDQVTNAIRALVEKKNELGLVRPIIDLEYIIMRHNEHELPAMALLGHQLGVDLVTYKTAYVMDKNNTEQVNKYIPTNLHFSRYQKDANGFAWKANVRDRCHRLWRIGTIYWDGTMAGCCCDQNSFAPMGNVLTNGLRAVWQSNQYNDFRQKMIGALPRPAICDNCTGGLHRFYLVDTDKRHSFIKYRLRQLQIYGSQFFQKYV